MATEIFIQRDGIVNHRHDGVKGWHNPATKHAGDLHGAENAANPANAADLNVAPIGAFIGLGLSPSDQYAQALGGKSFYGYYNVALKDRKEAAGDGWGYANRAAPKPVISKAQAIQEELDALEEAVAFMDGEEAIATVEAMIPEEGGKSRKS